MARLICRLFCRAYQNQCQDAQCIITPRDSASSCQSNEPRSASADVPGHYDQCKAPSLIYFRTKFQYWRRILSRRGLPHFTIGRNARLAVRPANAADMKQFCVPGLQCQHTLKQERCGITLTHVCEPRRNSVANGK
jgi:hypothetical protein